MRRDTTSLLTFVKEESCSTKSSLEVSSLRRTLPCSSSKSSLVLITAIAIASFIEISNQRIFCSSKTRNSIKLRSSISEPPLSLTRTRSLTRSSELLTTSPQRSLPRTTDLSAISGHAVLLHTSSFQVFLHSMVPVTKKS